MKDLSIFLSAATLVILFGYITYAELNNPDEGRISDDGVVVSYSEDPGHPLPARAYNLPAELSFAGEPVPMELPDVRERLDKELLMNAYYHSNTIFLIKRAHRWMPQMEPILKQYDIPDDFKYLPLVESYMLNVVSPKDAVGFWQILDDSGRELGLEVTREVDERYDPLKATEAACKYLRKAYDKFGNWTLVAASYNRGRAGLQRAIDDQQVKDYYDLYLNDETSRYVFRLLAIREIIEQPGRYGFQITEDQLYQPEPVRYVEVNETIKDLVSFSLEHGINYKLLKRHNPWLREDRLTVKRGKHYQIAIPLKP